mgnify:CR=1 FL=1
MEYFGFSKNPPEFPCHFKEPVKIIIYQGSRQAIFNP